MFNIARNNIITITRGDTAKAELLINTGTSLEPNIIGLGNQDAVYFGIMEPNQPFEHAIVKKKISNENFNSESTTVVIYFDSTDTEFLLPGVYYYSVKLYRPNGDSDGEDARPLIDTIIPKTKFIILD